MDSPGTHRRPRKIRRTGRHTTPSGVEKVAEKAGKAAPAMAIAGMLVAVPQAHAATKAPVKAATVAEQVHTDALVRHLQPTTSTYTVQARDTLSKIAGRFYGNPADWPSIYDVNLSVVHDPNDIYVGEVLKIPADPATTTYTPKHAKATVLTASATVSGTLSCTGLEELWEEAGGPQAEAFTAAEIAMAESGGNPNAISPTDDYGLWQINASHGALATLNPLGNAKAAVIISDDGTNWTPWTTYTSGDYVGRC
jgi:LysM repeat protein